MLLFFCCCNCRHCCSWSASIVGGRGDVRIAVVVVGGGDGTAVAIVVDGVVGDAAGDDAAADVDALRSRFYGCGVVGA